MASKLRQQQLVNRERMAVITTQLDELSSLHGTLTSQDLQPVKEKLADFFRIYDVDTEALCFTQLRTTTEVSNACINKSTSLSRPTLRRHLSLCHNIRGLLIDKTMSHLSRHRMGVQKTRTVPLQLRSAQPEGQAAKVSAEAQACPSNRSLSHLERLAFNYIHQTSLLDEGQDVQVQEVLQANSQSSFGAAENAEATGGQLCGVMNHIKTIATAQLRVSEPDSNPADSSAVKPEMGSFPASENKKWPSCNNSSSIPSPVKEPADDISRDCLMTNDILCPCAGSAEELLPCTHHSVKFNHSKSQHKPSDTALPHIPSNLCPASVQSQEKDYSQASVLKPQTLNAAREQLSKQDNAQEYIHTVQKANVSHSQALGHSLQLISPNEQSIPKVQREVKQQKDSSYGEAEVSTEQSSTISILKAKKKAIVQAKGKMNFNRMYRKTAPCTSGTRDSYGLLGRRTILAYTPACRGGCKIQFASNWRIPDASETEYGTDSSHSQLDLRSLLSRQPLRQSLGIAKVPEQYRRLSINTEPEERRQSPPKPCIIFQTPIVQRRASTPTPLQKQGQLRHRYSRAEDPTTIPLKVPRLLAWAMAKKGVDINTEPHIRRQTASNVRQSVALHPYCLPSFSSHSCPHSRSLIEDKEIAVLNIAESNKDNKPKERLNTRVQHRNELAGKPILSINLVRPKKLLQNSQRIKHCGDLKALSLHL